MIRKVVLVVPNFLIREAFGDPAEPPLGVAYIAAVLEKEGYQVSIIDANAENLSIQEIEHRLLTEQSDLVGISCDFSPLHNPTLQIAAMVKNRLGVPVVVGGNHATAATQYMIRQADGTIDFIARGEGEAVLPPLIRALQHDADLVSVQGITYLYDGRVVSTPLAQFVHDLDRLPFPAYHLLPMDKYARHAIHSARGCPFNCSFCASHVIFGHRVRRFSAERVVDEMEYVLKRYGRKQFWFSDDTFTANQAYIDKLLDVLIARKLNVTWSCLTRVNLVSRDLLLKMREAGCAYISYGVESGDEAMLRAMGKGITLDRVRETLTMTMQCGLRVYAFFLVGNPGETWNSIRNSYRLIKQVKPDGASFAVVIPLPGTQLWDKMVNRGFIGYDIMQWDYLFAKLPGGRYKDYAAQVAAQWCDLTANELMRACIIGEHLPRVGNLLEANRNLCEIGGVLDEEALRGLYSAQDVTGLDLDMFIETAREYWNG